MMDDLQNLIEQLKAATADNPPHKGFSDDETALMDQIRAYGEPAIEPLIAFMTQLMAETEATIERDTDEEEKLTYYFADAHITEILCDLPLAEDHVRSLFSLLADYPDNDWYHSHLIGSIGQRGDVVVGPALELLRDRSNDYFVRNTAAEVLENVISRFPDQRERVADELVAIMSGAKRGKETDDDRVVNAFMLSTLGETRQEQHIPFIKKMFKSRRVDESVTDLNWVLDSIQGIDPMDRLGGLEDSPIARAAMLGQLALSLGYKDTDELFEAISAGEIPDPFDSDDPDDKFLPESFPRWTSFDRPDPLAPFHAEKLPGRNDPCWCGSGKKYKHCHMREDKQKKSGDN